MNLGNIFIDFCEPITFDQHIKDMKTNMSFEVAKRFDPFVNSQDRKLFSQNLAYRIIYELQNNIRIMPTTLVASILLMDRGGITRNDLLAKVRWLGQTLKKRGILLQS